jgi:hypothetical protein
MSGDWTCPAGRRWHLAGDATLDAAPTCPQCGGPSSPLDTGATLDPTGATPAAPPSAARLAHALVDLVQRHVDSHPDMTREEIGEALNQFWQSV